MNIRHLRLPLALALALGASGAHALGLGPIEVKSGLNQPLVAEIPILSAGPGELDELEVRLASPEAFVRVGLERPVGLTANLQMEVGRNAAGQPVIRVTTPGRFDEPFLTFLLEANWGRGSVVREFSALVDPPYIAPAVIRPLETPTVAIASPPPAPPEPAPVYEPPQAVAVPAPEDRITVTEIPPEPVEEVAAAPEPLPPEPLPAPAAEPVPEPSPEPEPRPEPIAAAPEPTPEPVPEPALEPQPEPVPAPSPPAPMPAPAPAVAAPQPTLGPVAEGQTLWSIADRARLENAVTVNQMMVALQRANPEAFIDDNINLLKQGAVLRIPSRDEIVTLGDAEAALIVREQATAWNSRRAPVPQPVETVADEPAPAATPARRPTAATASTDTAAPGARLEIVPPSGSELAARGAQSGASESGGGSELRAELSQAREDLAAKESEITELRSQIDELEKQQADSQRLLQLQDSRMKALQDRLAKQQAAAGDAPDAAPAAAADAPTAAATTAAGEPPADATPPWYWNPYVLGGGAVLLLGGLVFALRGRRGAEPMPVVTRRISDDEAVKASLPGGRAPAVAPEDAPADAVAPAAATGGPSDAAGRALRDAVEARPDDLEAHISLLRHHYARGDVAAYESAAQAMRTHVRSTLDPRWREAVVMGVAMSPGNLLFSQAGWNAPRFSDSGVMPAMPPKTAAATPTTAEPVATAESQPPIVPAGPPAPMPEPAYAPEPSFLRDEPPAPAVAAAPAPPADDGDHGDALLAAELQALDADLTAERLPDPDTSAVDLDLDPAADAGAEEDGSATKIELARAYLDIGDVDGARGMLEEVLAEGGPRGRAEASQLLKEIG